MGFISSLFGSSNDFRAAAPKNDFQAQEATLDKTNFSDAIQKARDAAVNGDAGSSTEAGQTALVRALQAQMAGNGPSLAQRQLQQATEQIQQQAAGAVASQRGINPALAARQILDAQNNAAQNAAGQSATLRLQEQLSTQDRLAQALAAQRGQDISQQQANTAALGTVGGLQQGQNALALQNKLGTQQLNQATGAQNASLNLGAQQINAGVASQNAQTNAGIVGGVLGGAGAVMGLADGGVVPLDASSIFPIGGAGGVSNVPTGYEGAETPTDLPGAPSKLLKQIGAGMGGFGGGLQNAGAAGANAFYRTLSHPVLGAILARGGVIPGTAPVSGDSRKNDTVPSLLSPGEIVLPRSVAQAEDAPDRAAAFVAAIRKEKPKTSAPNYGHTLAKMRELDGRLKRVELAMGGPV